MFVYVAQVVVVSLGGFCCFALHSLHSPLSTATIKFYFMFMASVCWKLFLLSLLLLFFSEPTCCCLAKKNSVAISVSWLLNINWNSSRRALKIDFFYKAERNFSEIINIFQLLVEIWFALKIKWNNKVYKHHKWQQMEK